MKFILIFTLFFLGKDERAKIKEALLTLSLTPRDLSYDKVWIEENVFMLKAFREVMENPLNLPFYLKKTDSMIGENINNPRTLMKNLLKELDIEGVEVKVNKSKIDLYEIPFKELHKLIEEYVAFTIDYEEFLQKCMQNLKREEMESLLIYLPFMFEDEDDKSDDTLKGILHREKGFKADTSFKIKTQKIFKKFQKIEYGKILNYQLEIVSLADRIYKEVKRINTKRVKYKKIINIRNWKICINFEKENNIYEDEYLLIIDAWGDDIYKNNTLRGIGVLKFKPFSIVIDLDGDDIYKSEKIFSLASGFFGTGIIIDKKGNDFYKGGYYSIGSGFFGTGILIDKEGDDLYEGMVFSQGTGFFGTGILIDKKGNDTYRIWNYGQGFASTKGYGILYDIQGNDSYIAYGKFIHHPLLPSETRSFAQGFAIGWRPFASGGIGVLIDGEGNDLYYSEVYGQGTSYFYSIGMLLDKKGNDIYSASEYAQGSGIHLSAGILVDLEGHDDYISRYGPAQGEGHDLSVGILIDKKGDDTYKVSGGQGVGLTNSVGILIDSDGNDVYTTWEKGIGQGSGTWARGFCGIGIFIDLKGKDIYPCQEKENNMSMWIKEKYGVGYDTDSTKVLYPEEEGKEVEIPDTIDIKELFKIASEWGVRENKKKVKKAREMLAERGEESLEYIFREKINTIKTLEIRAITEVIEKNKEKSIPYLLKAMKSENDTIRKNAIYLIGKAKIEQLADSVGKLLSKEKNERIKSVIIYTLGRLENKNFISDIKKCFTGKEFLKISVCEYFQKVKDSSSVDFLIDIIKKETGVIRFSAESALVNQGKIIEEKLIEETRNSKDPLVTSHFLRTLPKISSSPKVKEILIHYLDSPSWFLRGISARGLAKIGGEGIREILKIKLETEGNIFVRREIENTLRN